MASFVRSMPQIFLLSHRLRLPFLDPVDTSSDPKSINLTARGNSIRVILGMAAGYRYLPPGRGEYWYARAELTDINKNALRRLTLRAKDFSRPPFQNEDVVVGVMD